MTVAKVALVAAAGGLIALVIAVSVAMASLPGFEELKSSPNGQMVQVRARDGKIIASIGPSYGQWLTYDQIPAVMSDAMVAVEDRRFYSHPGVDPIGLTRALTVRVERGRWVQGGSTITQQLARNIFLTNVRTFGRKFREAILALALEQRFTKREILELYLNRVYFGGGAYGIDAASRKFFGHPATELKLAEAAIIAGLVKAPSRYAPSADPKAAQTRAAIVIDVMEKQGRITASQAAIDFKDIRFVAQPRETSVRYFTDWALAQLDTLTDETVRSLDVWTTLDLDMQQAADAAIDRFTPAGAQGALIGMENDGAVRAMVGGRDYVTSIYNRGTQAERQSGSSFKLFTYLAAIEDGATPDDTVVDEPVTVENWSPRNNSRGYAGEMTLRQAFAYSVNTVAVKLGMRVGFDAVADMARRFGVTTPISTRPSTVLGVSDVRLIDMTRAYASVASGGVAVIPYGITRVTTGRDEVLFERVAEEPRVLVAPWVAASMTDLLKAAVETGTGRAAQIGRPLAGKTGTTSSNRDGWFLGFTKTMTTGVWMGRDDARAIPGLQGGRAPAQAFAAFMTRALRKVPVGDLTTELSLPAGHIEPDDEVYGIGPYDDNQMMVDPDGMPVGGEPPYPPDAADPAQAGDGQPRLDDGWLNNVLDGNRPLE
jgi:penicillin-binding protein 1A